MIYSLCVSLLVILALLVLLVLALNGKAAAIYNAEKLERKNTELREQVDAGQRKLECCVDALNKALPPLLSRTDPNWSYAYSRILRLRQLQHETACLARNCGASTGEFELLIARVDAEYLAVMNGTHDAQWHNDRCC